VGTDLPADPGMIVVRDLEKHFGPTRAVDRISFSVQQGEVVGFLGPNGAGKTTTIRVLTCFHPATGGSAEVAGHDVRRQPVEVRRQIGYLPENVPIYPDLRVEEYLRYRAALKGVPRAQRRGQVGRAMEKAGVVEVRRRLVGHVSRGYRQRVGLADALVANPPILILDEPTSGLDPNQRRRIKQLVRELAQEHTILFSSHVLAEVQDVSTRILLIHRGRLRADGAPQELVAKSGGRALRVEAHATPDALLACARDLPGVGDLRAAPGEPGLAVLTATVAAGADPRDAVAGRAAAQGLRLRELRLELPSLEEFFFALTEGADRAEEARAEEAAAAGAGA
jgi:ABC-2 type transport system ATP-binding protein